MFKYIAFTLLVLAPAAARADKNFLGGKGATWDCKKDPEININHGNGKYTFKGACKAININGGQNVVSVESVEDLSINGGGNKITVGEVNTINVLGADNVVTYKKGKDLEKPSINAVGTNNKIGAEPAKDKK